MDEYKEFLAGKAKTFQSSGFSIADGDLNQKLKDWQREVVRWGLRKGRAAFFEGCGLGKTAQQLEWAWRVHLHTGGMVLLLAPLAVAEQTHYEEAVKFGISTTLCRTSADLRPGINITNYEMLHHFDPSAFVGVVADESSLLKALDGATKQTLIESFRETPY